MYRQSIIKSRRRIQSKTETCIKHSFLSYEVNLIQSGAVTKRQAGFRLFYHWHSKLCRECPTPSETRVWSLAGSALGPRVPSSPGPAPGLQSEVEVLLWLAGSRGGDEQVPRARGYCVVTSFTIMLMIREPRGHVHRSVLGFLILSWRSWSSSQRSSFTSSAIYNENAVLAVLGGKGKAFIEKYPIMIIILQYTNEAHYKHIYLSLISLYHIYLLFV